VSLILTNVVLILIGSVDVMDRLHWGEKLRNEGHTDIPVLLAK